MRLRTMLLAVLATAGTVCAPASATALNDETPTIAPDIFALRPVIRNVQVSPDGKHLALLKIEGRDGNPIIEIYETDDLSEPKRRLAADPMQFLNLQWISDDIIGGQSIQMVRRRIRSRGQSVFRSKFYTYDLPNNEFEQFDGSFSVVSPLPNDPDKVLIGTSRINNNELEDDPFEAFRPREYYTLNLQTGAKSLVLKGNEKYPQATFDANGNPRFTSGIDPATKEIVTYYRAVGESSWNEGFRLDGKTEAIFRDDVSIVGFDGEDPNRGYALTRQGDDKIGLYEFDFATGQIGDLIYRNPEADLVGAVPHSRYWGGEAGDIAAVTYPGEKYERHFLDETEELLYERLEQAIPDAHQVSINSRSADGSVMTISNVGPHDPGTTYLLKDGALQVIGKRNPLLPGDQMADVEYVKYPARDGRMIPAYVTKPQGEGPFPLVVLPHGGPYVNEVITFDPWSQLLAHQGYMVIQPQYRGSEGHGYEHFRSALNQYGLAMQDDLEDGVTYLVERGEVDPERVAMFGWSYGGYTALIQATREPQMFQCTVGGAAPADSMLRFNNTARGNIFPYGEEFARQRGAYAGVNPITVVDDINIPMLVMHGDVDDNVVYEHFKKYKKAVKAAGKDDLVDFMTLEKADHGSFTWSYETFNDLYTELVRYMEEDCGPGGL